MMNKILLAGFFLLLPFSAMGQFNIGAGFFASGFDDEAAYNHLDLGAHLGYSFFAVSGGVLLGANQDSVDFFYVAPAFQYEFAPIGFTWFLRYRFMQSITEGVDANEDVLESGIRLFSYNLIQFEGSAGMAYEAEELVFGLRLVFNLHNF